MRETIKKVCVCGAGTMGSGIAQVCATAGYTTILYEVNPSVLEKAVAGITSSLKKNVEKGKLSAPEADAITGRILFTGSVKDCQADLFIEAIVEIPAVKSSLFRQLSSLNPGEVIFASNTSSLSISELAQEVENPERFAGLHFFNPATLMKLVEVVKGKQTSDNVVSALHAFTLSLGKTPVICTDSPGFIVNRVARPFYIEALRLAEENFSSFDVTDKLMESCGFRMGPFRLMDLIGNDINYAVSCSVYEQLHKPERLRPSPIQKEKVASGALGRKTGNGYYPY